MARRDYNTSDGELAALWAQWDNNVTVKETFAMQTKKDCKGHFLLTTKLSERQLGRHHIVWAKHREKYPIPRLRNQFHWPQDIGVGNDKVPFQFSQYTTRCMEYYLTEFEEWPRIGLVKRFAEVAAAQPRWDNRQIAVFAELIWYADLIGSTPGNPEKGTTLNRPDTRHIELSIITNRSDKILALSDKYEIPKQTEIEGRWVGYLPLFAATRHGAVEWEKGWQKGSLSKD